MGALFPFAVVKFFVVRELFYDYLILLTILDSFVTIRSLQLLQSRDYERVDASCDREG